MEKSFHNTIGLTQTEVNLEDIKCKSQEDVILKMFFVEPRLTRSDVINRYPNKMTPITSIGRGLTNLKTAGILEKTSFSKIGMYGKPEYYYQLPFIK